MLIFMEKLRRLLITITSTLKWLFIFISLAHLLDGSHYENIWAQVLTLYAVGLVLITIIHLFVIIPLKQLDKRRQKDE
jgi:hypothetical protein